jgi:hypothetical protein
MTPVLFPPDSEPFLSRRARWSVVIVLVLIVVLAAFLLLPTDTIVLPAWVPAVQAELRALLQLLLPYLGVALLGALVAVAELASTFATYPREALSTRWARILILVNVVAAGLALLIARVTMPETNPVLLVIGVGVGFQAIIRTRFVLARSMNGADGSNNEVSLNLGWLYEQFQHLCRTQIDLELMNNRRTAVTQLIQYYPSIAELYDIAYYTIIARATLTDEQEAMRLQQLQTLIDPKAPEQFARSSMALAILENGGPAYVQVLLNQAMTDSGAVTRQTEQNTLVRQLAAEYSLTGLIQLTHRLTEATDVRQWVEQAAAPSPEAREADQKAAIAYFLLQEIGEDKVRQMISPPG